MQYYGVYTHTHKPDHLMPYIYTILSSSTFVSTPPWPIPELIDVF